MPDSSRNLKVEDEHYRELVAILFAVVVGFSIDTYNETIFVTSLTEIITPEWFAIILIYIAIILSWIGYHFWLSKYSYDTKTTRGVIRLFVDVAIVVLYAYLLYTVHWIIDPKDAPTLMPLFDSAGGVAWFLLGYILVFVLYIINDLLVLPKDEYCTSVLGLCKHAVKCFFIAFGYIIYSLWPGGEPESPVEGAPGHIVKSIIAVMGMSYFLWLSRIRCCSM